MATTRKHWRKIQVDDRVYRWKVSRKDYYEYSGTEWNHTVIVENILSGSLLKVFTEYSAAWGPKLSPERPVLPSDVARYIRQSKLEGWTEQKQPQPFLVDISK